MKIFRKNSKFPIGIDISDYNLKLIQINSKGRDSLEIQAISKVTLEKGLINDGDIINKIKVLDALKTLLSKPLKGKVTSREVVACLPETKTYLKLINVEKSPNELSQVIEAEMEKHIPFPIDEIYYDYQIISSDRNSFNVLIGACPKRFVNQYIDILKEAKLSIVGLEIEAIAISRSLIQEEVQKKKKKPQKKNYLVIDMGAKRTSMFVYSQNTPLFTLNLPISGGAVTSKIANFLEIDDKQAEKAKIVCGMDKKKAKGIIRNVLVDTLDEIVDKIEDAIDYFKNHFPDRGEINQIIISGGGSSIKDLENYLQEATSIETIKGDSLINLNNSSPEMQSYFVESYKLKNDFSIADKDSKSLTITQDDRLAFSTAIGLGLRNVFNSKL
ncbi:hypothetical protein C0584_03400 [Candidatus Parcubacteria bacterium]|nr:MAG: hypothetical protein C0584_03400 [Candidatus Parcubacteria bacterium]